MKTKTIINLALVSFLFCVVKDGKCDIDTNYLTQMLNTHIDYHTETGLVYLNENSLTYTELMDLYNDMSEHDEDNRFPLENDFNTSNWNLHHYKHRQFFKNVFVEGATVNIHVRDDYVVWINGKVANLSGNATPTIGKEQALFILDTDYEGWEGDEVFSWEVQQLEDSLISISGNPDTSYFPLLNGKLVWALDRSRKLGSVISGDLYRLAWKFRINCASPLFEKDFYVDAHTGEVFKIMETTYSNGIISSSHHGTRSIDTKERGWPHNDQILKTNDNGINIHSKYYNWLGFVGNINNPDSNWDVNEIEATIPHWMVTEAWLFFRDEYGINGTNFGGKPIRLIPDMTVEYKGAVYDPEDNYDIIYIGYNDSNDYADAIDIMFHEYSHGVMHHTSSLYPGGESGALGESFADIMGFIGERHVEGQISDWTMAEDAYSDIQFRRSFIDPKSSYMHYLNENCDIWTIGQADTYEGEFWEDNDCDAGGIHINAGVQNHWFYLLSEGGSGSNDNEDSYFVNGIGPDAAGSIALLNMMTLDESAQFEDARDNALAVSVAIYGDLCSVESFECARAWHAVGVGEPIECEGLGIKNEALSSIKLFPNPSSTEVTIANIKDMNAKLTVTNLLGSTILAHELKIGENTINVSQWSKGTYFFQIGSINGESRTLEFIKL